MSAPSRIDNAGTAPLIVRSVIALCDQAMLSAVSFLVTILLIKAVPKHEYGYYSIASSISLFLVSLQNATVNGPLTVLLPSKNRADKERYIASLGLGQLLILGPLTGIGAVLLAFLYVAGANLLIPSVAAALTFATTGTLLREFVRAVYFAEQSPTKVLKLDALFGVIYLGLVGITAAHLGLTVPALLLHAGLSGLAVSTHFTLKSHSRATLASLRQDYTENWQYAKWALIGVSVTHIQNYGYLYMLASLVGSTTVGDASASRLLLMPFLLLQAGWARVAMPHGCHLREAQEMPRFFRHTIIAAVVATILIAIYVCLLIPFADPLTRLIFNHEYATAPLLIVLWGIVFIAEFVALNATLGLLVIKNFRLVSQINVITMFITLVTSYLLIKKYALYGALASLAIGQSSLAVALWYCFTLNVFGKGRTPGALHLEETLSSWIYRSEAHRPATRMTLDHVSDTRDSHHS